MSDYYEATPDFVWDGDLLIWLFCDCPHCRAKEDRTLERTMEDA